jgi:hypothetical protein
MQLNATRTFDLSTAPMEINDKVARYSSMICYWYRGLVHFVPIGLFSARQNKWLESVFDSRRLHQPVKATRNEWPFFIIPLENHPDAPI